MIGKRLTDREYRYMQENEISQAEDRISNIIDDVIKPFIGIDLSKTSDQSQIIYMSSNMYEGELMNKKEQENLSKYLALILRHKPEVIGITLDEHGWANVKDLINGINKTQHFTMGMLEKIVEEDSKQRYSFNREKTLIRANQGHSIPVDVELKECAPPDILFHGTGSKYCKSIDRDGLKPKSRLYVHLSEDIDTAINVGSRHGDPMIYKVKAKEMYDAGYKFYLSVNGIWLTKEVPIIYLEK